MVQAGLPNSIQTRDYWVENFKILDGDIDYIYNLFLETEEPLSLRDITAELIEHRINQETSQLRKKLKNSVVFQPKNSYKLGQIVIFPQFEYLSGTIVNVREGKNSEYGSFQVIEVEFEDKTVREFACELNDHALNAEPVELAEIEIEPDVIFRNYGRSIARKIKARFDQDEDVVYLAGRWFLKSLLADINIAHLNLAEAILDIAGGGPLTTEEIFEQIGMASDISPHLQIFSLDYAMQQDPRFDEVGPAGEVLWYLQRMEPEQVRKTPIQLEYDEIAYNQGLFTDEMKDLLVAIDDELSPIEREDEEEQAVTLTLTYPYRRTGTLPLSTRLQYLFPTAYETTRIRITLVDAATNEEAAGWVVRELGYVYGFEEFYKKYMLPVGAYITVRRHAEDPNKLLVDFQRRPRARTETIRLAVPEVDRLRFESLKRQVVADYDELMNFGVEDLAGLDRLWPIYKRLPLDEILRRLIPPLADLSPQKAVHVMTLYSAVNLVRRCPPDPIFATLLSHPDFGNVGGPYWRLTSR
jgi:hypothetical protein